MFRLFKRKPALTLDAKHALTALRMKVERMNIPAVSDNFDAGYDIAVDEVLALIDEALNPSARNDDVSYGENE